MFCSIGKASGGIIDHTDGILQNKNRMLLLQYEVTARRVSKKREGKRDAIDGSTRERLTDFCQDSCFHFLVMKYTFAQKVYCV